MSRVRVACFSLSLDGFAAGPGQDLDNPLGRGATELHQWLFPTRAFQQTLMGVEGGETGINNDFAVSGFDNIGAWIIGRNMFGPVRGPWSDSPDWSGWWGDEPPYHVPVFVLTHHPRPVLEMAGGTSFHFVTGGFEEALARAREAAGDKDLRIGGGAATIRQFLRAGLIDELHLAIVPVLMGGGESLMAGLDLRKLGYNCASFVPSDTVTHVVLRRSDD